MPYAIVLSTTITIDVKNLLVGTLILVGIILGIYLISVLVKLSGTIKKINELVDELEEPVHKTVKQLPELIQKIENVTDDVSVIAESAKKSVPPVLDDVQNVTKTIRSSVDTIGEAAKSIGESVSSFFQPGKSSKAGFTARDFVDIVDQVVSVIGLFTGHSKKRKGGWSKRRKR